MKKGFRTIMMMALALCVMCGSAFAAEIGVSLDASVTLEGTLPATPEQFRIVLTANDESYPMPGGKTGGTTSIAIAGAAEGVFDEIVYERVGIYTYTLDQVNGQNADCTYDQTVYDVTVFVVNAEDGEGFEATVVMYAQGSDKKCPANFHNVYVTVTPPPGEVTDTGVQDKWPWYLAGAIAMLILAAIAIKVLREQFAEEAQPETGGITDADLAELAEDLDADFYEDEENDKK